MAAFSISIFTAIAIAILRCASAVSTDNSNYTTTFVLPDQLFIPVPDSTTFVGQMTINSSTTYYTVNCGHDSNFFPYPCSDGPSYTFSASSATTQYLIAEYEIPLRPPVSVSPPSLGNPIQEVYSPCQRQPRHFTLPQRKHSRTTAPKLCPKVSTLEAKNPSHEQKSC